MSDRRKRGRRPQNYIDPDTGNPVLGLARRPSDGRWRVIATGFTFTEADERKAIERFRKMDQTPEGRVVLGRKVKGTRGEFQELRDYVASIIEQNQREAYAKFAADIIAKPQWVAKMTGIEQLGYLTDLRPPEKLPTLTELETLWMEKASCSVGQRKKVRRAWRDFVDSTGIGGLADISPEVAVAYEDAVHGRGLSGKQQGHLFSGIRRVLRFATKRKVAVAKMTKVLAELQSWESSEDPDEGDPQPIGVEDFHKLLAKSEGDTKAMLLLMLNGAFYMGEVVELQWEDIKNGCIVTNRHKTGKCIRACVLWQETLDALAKLKRCGPFVFYNYRGEPLQYSGAYDRWAALKGAAKVSDVHPSHLRDGAATAAAEANVNERLCNLLLGHKCGISGRYIKRRPSLVAAACEAVYRAYFGRATVMKVAG